MRVYIAAPYISDPIGNTEKAIDAGNLILSMGHAPFVPHLAHYWNRLHTEHPEDTWLTLDLAWLEASEAVVRLPGASSGADKEVARALELGIPVYSMSIFYEKFREES